MYLLRSYLINGMHRTYY